MYCIRDTKGDGWVSPAKSQSKEPLKDTRDDLELAVGCKNNVANFEHVVRHPHKRRFVISKVPT